MFVPLEVGDGLLDEGSLKFTCGCSLQRRLILDRATSLHNLCRVEVGNLFMRDFLLQKHLPAFSGRHGHLKVQRGRWWLHICLLEQHLILGVNFVTGCAGENGVFAGDVVVGAETRLFRHGDLRNLFSLPNLQLSVISDTALFQYWQLNPLLFVYL